MFRDCVGLMKAKRKEKSAYLYLAEGCAERRMYMNIAQTYVDGLKEAYYENGGERQWNDFERVGYLR